MKTAGIVAEFNPFHNGHLSLFRRLKENGATHLAVAMSGNFVQRGEPAILSKWARARQALLCGADLVVEIPLPWAVAGAEKFAFGGVSLLAAL
ncbi:MAG TPA: nucleotidyltransferase, partial [Ruminococcaceae bacterium]|nr:nucleotidyltransferase [Oscillospiraceae bacterium]